MRATPTIAKDVREEMHRQILIRLLVCVDNLSHIDDQLDRKLRHVVCGRVTQPSQGEIVHVQPGAALPAKNTTLGLVFFLSAGVNFLSLIQR